MDEEASDSNAIKKKTIKSIPSINNQVLDIKLNEKIEKVLQ